MRHRRSVILIGIACALASIPGCTDRGERSKTVTGASTETGATLSGRVLNFQNKNRGVGNALVRGRNEPVSVFSARTAPDGSFQTTVPDGTHVVTAQGGGCRNMNRGVNIPFSTDVRVVVENGQVATGAQPAADGTGQLPLMYMDCRELPVVTIRNARGPDFRFTRTGPTDDELTVFFAVAASPSLLQCTLAGDSVTFPRGARQVLFMPVEPRGAGPILPQITVTLRPADEYEVGSPGSATEAFTCG
jgi:hypothetical protein